MFRQPLDSDKDCTERTIRFEREKEILENELSQPNVRNRGILFEKINNLLYKIELTKMTRALIESAQKQLQNKLSELENTSSTSDFCGTALHWHINRINTKLSAIEDELKFRNKLIENHFQTSANQSSQSTLKM